MFSNILKSILIIELAIVAAMANASDSRNWHEDRLARFKSFKAATLKSSHEASRTRSLWDGPDFPELVVIQDAETMNKFKQGGYGMAAEASAVALKPGAAAHAQFKKGVAVFVLIKSGAMAEAAVAGQKFRYSAGDSDRDEMNSHRRSEADTAGDRTRPITNISGSTSISTPNGGDAGVHGSTNVSGSTSVTTPNNGDRGVNSTDKRTTTTNGDGTKTTTTEEKTTTTK